MRSVEVTAKSREDAINQALQQLGVERDEIETEILQHGSKGIFGFGAREWNLRVSTEAASPVSDKPKREGGRGRGRGRRGGGSGEGRKRESNESKRNEKQTNKRDGKPKSGGRRSDNDSKRSDRPERKPRSDRKPRSERPERKPRSERPSETPGSAEVAVAAAAGPRKSTEASDTEAAALLQEMIQLMGIESEVSNAEDEDKNLRLAVSSEDSALLIGRKGRGLAALQYVINRVARGIEGRDETERIIVDVEGYLDRRKQSLEEMALRMAERVKETGRRFSMRPMNPQERRVVHVALQEDEELRTFSVGDSAIRRVVIAPKDEEREERPRRRPQRDRNEGRDRNTQRDRGRDRDRDDSNQDNGNGLNRWDSRNEAKVEPIENVDQPAAEAEDTINESLPIESADDGIEFEAVSDGSDTSDETVDVEAASSDASEESVEAAAHDTDMSEESVEAATENSDISDEPAAVVAEKSDGNGESSNEAEPEKPRRRRRSSTYRRGKR